MISTIFELRNLSLPRSWNKDSSPGTWSLSHKGESEHSPGGLHLPRRKGAASQTCVSLWGRLQALEPPGPFLPARLLFSGLLSSQAAGDSFSPPGQGEQLHPPLSGMHRESQVQSGLSQFVNFPISPGEEETWLYGAVGGFPGTGMFSPILQQPFKAGVIVPFHTWETKAQRNYLKQHSY